MATIEEFCSDILILNKGKTVLQGNLKENEFTITRRWKERTDQKIEGRSEIEASFLRVEKSKGL